MWIFCVRYWSDPEKSDKSSLTRQFYSWLCLWVVAHFGQELSTTDQNIKYFLLASSFTIVSLLYLRRTNLILYLDFLHLHVTMTQLTPRSFSKMNIIRSLLYETVNINLENQSFTLLLFFFLSWHQQISTLILKMN